VLKRPAGLVIIGLKSELKSIHGAIVEVDEITAPRALLILLLIVEFVCISLEIQLQGGVLDFDKIRSTTVDRQRRDFINQGLEPEGQSPGDSRHWTLDRLAQGSALALRQRRWVRWVGQVGGLVGWTNNPGLFAPHSIPVVPSFLSTAA
jgi:hypothetical protein